MTNKYQVKDLIELNTREQLKEYLKNTQHPVTIIKLTATWCNPCRQLNPVIKELNNFYMSKGIDYEYIELDVDNSVDIYSFFKKMKMANGIPTILSFKKELYEDDKFYVPFRGLTSSDPNAVAKLFSDSLIKQEIKPNYLKM
jgi:thiol-disulfide isomerase/thioredoxin